MATISYTAVLPVPLDDAFSFVSNPNNWPSFFQDMQSAEVLDGVGSRWWHGTDDQQAPRTHGDVAPHAHRVGGTISIPYQVGQEARPDVDNLRIFEEVEGGTRSAGERRP